MPRYSPNSPIPKPMSPDYLPPSDEYSPSVPYYGRPRSARYSPTSPEYSPRLPGRRAPVAGSSLTSPIYVASPPRSRRSSSSRPGSLSGESVASSVTFGRQSPSTPARTPLSPVSQVVRAVRSLGNIFTRRSISASPEEGQSPIDRFESSWQNIRRAQGRANLELAVRAFLEDWSIDELLGLIAEKHGEREETAVFRFGLRYLGGREWMGLEAGYQARLGAQMLLDELDLPGQRLSTALRRWRGVVAMADTLRGDSVHAITACLGASPVEEEEEEEGELPTRLLIAIQTFIDDQGLTRLIEVMEETHPEHAEVYFRNMISFENDVRIIQTPQPSEAGVMAFHIGSMLMGFEPPPRPLEVSRRSQPVRGVLPEWEEFEEDDWSSTASDDFVLPESARWSLRAIQRAADTRPVRWRRVFQRVRRHIDFYGLDATVRQYWASLDEAVKRDLEEDPRSAALLYGRLLGPRFRPEDNVAALIVDDLVATSRVERISASSIRASGVGRPHQAARETEALRREVICGAAFDVGDDEQKKEAHYRAHRHELQEYKKLRAAARRERSRSRESIIISKNVLPPLPLPGKRKRSLHEDGHEGGDELSPVPPGIRVRRVESVGVVVPRTPLPAAVAPVRRSSRVRERRWKQAADSQAQTTPTPAAKRVGRAKGTGSGQGGKGKKSG
ncbi:hypothetical protein LTR36_002867 [Oleoguttula mirabilis]|uniref:Uncharacterized protein n=1 Tax=Oleoguttula mirabilis TaxID=1507867 RepID=A0AAV9JK16_9PEZI|nr:hypothetical protein LTR36_002867 [Oleoguttula mirabilis]